MKGLTKRQREVLAFIQTFTAENGYSPSIQELRDGLGIGSNRGVTCHLAALESKGSIRRPSGIARGIQVLRGEG